MSSIYKPTCRAEQEDRRFPQEPINLIGYCDLSVGKWSEGLAVGLTHGVINVIEQNGKCLATQVWYLDRVMRLSLKNTEINETSVVDDLV